MFSMPFLFFFQKCFYNSVDFALLSYLKVFVKSVFKCILRKTVVIDSVTSDIPQNSTGIIKAFLRKKRKGNENHIMHWPVIDHTQPYAKGTKKVQLMIN